LARGSWHLPISSFPSAAVAMSTHACFERHKELARQHSERARMRLEDATTVWGGRKQGGQNAAPSAMLLGIARAVTVPVRAIKLVQSAVTEHHLAIREYKEATRLRPRDEATKKFLRAAQKACKSLEVALAGPRPRPMRRFLAHYNLSLRYWDMGKAKQAIAQAELACEKLDKARLPRGCAEHNLVLMRQVHSHYHHEEKRLEEALQRSPQAVNASHPLKVVNPSYKLGILFFDKRMLLRAEKQLRFTLDHARAVSALQLVQHDKQRHCQTPCGAPVWLSMERKKARRTTHLLEELEDDLDFISGLRERWCVEEEAGKAEELQTTGIRDGAQPHLLPCLHRRFAQDCRDCDQWWAQICERDDIDLHAGGQDACGPACNNSAR